MKEILSQNLKQFRTSKHFTQEQAAERLNVSPQAVSRWECGTTLPDAVLLPEIAKLYGVTIDDLFRKTSVAYENYAQRLAAVYEASQMPEDFLRAELEYQKLFASGEVTENDMCIYASIQRYMMHSCQEKALHWFRKAADGSRGKDEQVYHKSRIQQMGLLMQLGRAAEVLAEQERRVQDCPNRSEWNMLVAAYLMAERKEEAYACFRKAIERFPDDWELYVYGGDICSGLQRYEDAFAYWNKAIALRPDAPDPKYCKAFCYEEQGDYERAYRTFLEIAEDMKRAGYEVEAEAEIQRANGLKKKYQIAL